MFGSVSYWNIINNKILTAFKELAVLLLFSLNVRAGAEVISGSSLAALHTDQVHPSVVETCTEEIFTSGVTKVWPRLAANGLKKEPRFKNIMNILRNNK